MARQKKKYHLYTTIPLGFLLFILGGFVAWLGILYFQLYPMPFRLVEVEADGARIRFIHFVEKENHPPHGIWRASTVVVFYDWKNDGEIIRVPVPFDVSNNDRIFYSDEDRISTVIDGHLFLGYDKRKRIVEKKDFGSQYNLQTMTKDGSRFVALTSSEPVRVVLLDKSGKEVISQPFDGATPSKIVFFDHGQQLALVTAAEGDTPSALYVWDLVGNQLKKETRKETLDALLTGTLEGEGEEAYVRVINATGEDRIPVTFEATGELTMLDSSADTSTWKTYYDRAFGFSVKYPPQFAVSVHAGSSDFERMFLSLDIGTPEYLNVLNTPTESEGPPLFLRISAGVPTEAGIRAGSLKPGTCGSEEYLSEVVLIDGLSVSKCEGTALGSFPSLFTSFKKADEDSMIYTLNSMRYEGPDKAMIDQILATLKISKEPTPAPYE